MIKFSESLSTCEAAAKKAAHDGRAGSPIFGAYAMDREQATFFLLLSSIFDLRRATFTPYPPRAESLLS